MDKKVEQYIDSICSGLGLNSKDENDLRQELISHLAESISEFKKEGRSDKEAVQEAVRQFGNPQRIKRELKKAYLEVYLMSTIGRVIHSKPVAGIGLSFATLLIVASFSYGAWGVYRLFQLPPGPTSWHDANTEALTIIALSLPLLVLFIGSLINWYRTKEMPSKLVIWVAGLSAFLLVLNILATR